MPQYVYKARDNEGLPIRGAVDAVSELAVVTNLRSLGYRVVYIEEQSEAKRLWQDLLKRMSRITQAEVILFTRQLSSMLKSGLPITDALTSLIQQSKNETFVRVLQNVLKDIEKGESFSQALSHHPRVFNTLYVNMVKAGETAGVLHEVLDRLVVLKTQEMDALMRVRSAMVYPVILVTAAIFIVGFLMAVIIPKFVVIFETYEAKLPLATRVLMGLSFALKDFWFVFLLVMALGVFWFKRYTQDEEGRYQFHHLLIKLPVFGDFYVKMIVARFTRILGVLVRSGVTILEALAVTEKTINNVVISRVIEKIHVAVSEGQSLSEPFQASGIFPPMVIQMITVGEKSGRMDQMLAEISAYYDQETEYIIKNVTTILEPVLLLTMGGLVAFIALAVLLPIFNLIKVFRGGI